MSLKERRRTLEARLGELTGRIESIDDALEEPRSKDWEDQATEREGDEVLEDLGEQGRHEIAMIQAALKRMDEGTYGECVSCGAEISQERLDVLPATPFCRNCAR